MNRIYLFILFLIGIIPPIHCVKGLDLPQENISGLSQARLSSGMITLAQLIERCNQLPERPTSFHSSAIKKIEFDEIILTFKQHMSSQLDNANSWVNPEDKPAIDFRPFVQKVQLPEGSSVAMWGDLHGSIHSLLRSLDRLKREGYIDDTFKIIDPTFYMFFLGDYVDRGKYGVEVIYTLLLLKLVNPERVFLVRGNHEDAAICQRYGFATELCAKFGLAYESEAVYALYEYLPMALFLGKQDGTDFIQCCHGGIEPGFNPYQLLSSSCTKSYAWLGVLKRADWFKTLPSDWQQSMNKNHPAEQLTNDTPVDCTCPYAIGFLWNDFVDDNSTSFIKPSRHKFVWSFGVDAVNHYVKSSGYTISKIIRAHQHNGQMLKNLIKHKGHYGLWDGLVHTVLSAPAMGIEDFNYDSFIVVEVKDSWPITHYATSIKN